MYVFFLAGIRSIPSIIFNRVFSVYFVSGIGYCLSSDTEHGYSCRVEKFHSLKFRNFNFFSPPTGLLLVPCLVPESKFESELNPQKRGTGGTFMRPPSSGIDRTTRIIWAAWLKRFLACVPHRRGISVLNICRDR